MKYPPREGFLFGINGHSLGYDAYPDSTLEQQIKLAAELGSQVYRYNLVPRTQGDLQYLNKVIDYVHAYGMEFILVMDSSYPDPELVYDHAKFVAEQLDGKIKYIQAYGELDVGAMQGANGGDGTHISHYVPETLEMVTKSLKAMTDGIRAGSDNIEIMVGIAHVHTAFLEYVIEHGVDFDAIALDWYSNMGPLDSFLETLLTKFEQDVWLTETNLWDGSDIRNENARIEWLTYALDLTYNHPNPRVKGMLIYELLDEPTLPLQEAHFGLVYCDKNGLIEEPKPAYYEIQKLVGGGPIDNVVLPTTTTTKTPTTTVKKPDPTTSRAPTRCGASPGF